MKFKVIFTQEFITEVEAPDIGTAVGMVSEHDYPQARKLDDSFEVVYAESEDKTYDFFAGLMYPNTKKGE